MAGSAIHSFCTHLLTWAACHGRLDLSEPKIICNADALRNRHAKAYQLSKAGINLKMYIELHKSPDFIPPYLHNEQVPVTHCVYDAKAVGFHRRLDNGVDGGPSSEVASTDEVAHETDQLGDGDISRLTSETRSALRHIRHCLLQSGRRLHLVDVFGSDDEDDDLGDADLDFDLEDLDEEDDMELDLELEDDEEFLDADTMEVFEHDGEFYVTMYETASEDEEEEMHEAVENQSHEEDVD